MLFLTHRGFTDIKQECVPNGKITIKDLWPKIEDWESINHKVNKENIEIEHPIVQRAIINKSEMDNLKGDLIE